jgi:hypothetical protein
MVDAPVPGLIAVEGGSALPAKTAQTMLDDAAGTMNLFVLLVQRTTMV